MEEAVTLNSAEPASVEADGSSLSRCEHVLELLLTHPRRGSRPGMCLHRYDKLQLTFPESVDPVP